MIKRVKVSKETGAASVGLKGNLVISTKLKMLIGHRNEFALTKG